MRHPTVEALLTRTPENEAHLAGCPDCRLIVEMMRFAPDEAQDAAPRDVPIIERSVFTDWEELPDGRGGMGKLWRAFDTRLGRQVAVKQVRTSPGADRDLHASLLRRLEREARFTARLQHPAIVAVYEVGRFPDGELFYAMPLVPGRPLAKEIDERRTLEARLGLLPQLTSVAEAIAYAHEKGVVHRDIKPQNILVGAFGEAVVIDWGLAKEWGPLGDRAGDEGTAQLPAAPEDGLTEFGVGTPQYMAPEQARGEQPTPLVDVYALGSTLYHALTGQPPYGLAESKEIRKALLVAPPRALTEAVPDVPPELAHICERAMARDPRDRYVSARELADELRRFQTGKLLASRTYTRAELVRHFIKRNRGPLVVAAAALVILIGLSIVGVANIRAQRDRAELHRLEAERALRRAQGVLASRLAAEAPRRLEALALGLRAVGPELIGQAPGEPSHEATQGLLDALAAGPAPRPLLHPGAVTDFDLSPDGTLLAGAGDDKTILLWDARTGAERMRARSTLADPHFVRFEPDGKRVVVCGNNPRGELHDLGGGPVRRFDLGSAPAGCLFLPDGTLVAATADLLLLDPATGQLKERSPLPAHAVYLSIAQDTGHLALALVDGSVWVRAPGSTLQRVAGAGAVATSLTINRDGSALAFARRDGSIRALQHTGDTWRETARLDDDPSRASASRARFSPDGQTVSVPLWSEEEVVTHTLLAPSGRHLASAAVFAQDWDAHGRFFADAHGVFVLLDARDGLPVLSLSGHTDEVKSAAALTDGAASASRDGADYLWDLREGISSGLLLGHTSEITLALTDAARKRAITGGLDGTLRVWDLTTGASLAEQRGGSGVTRAAFSSDGRSVFVGRLDGTLTRFDPATSASSTLWSAGAPISALTLVAGGELLAASFSGAMALFHLEGAGDRGVGVEGAGIDGAGVTGARAGFGTPGTAILAAAASPHGQVIISAGADGSVIAWDARSRQRLASAAAPGFDEGPEGHMAVVFLDDDRVLFGRPGGETLLADARTLATLRTLPGRPASPTRSPLSADGRLFAAANSSGGVTVHDLVKETSERLPDGGVVLSTDFSADGAWLATGDLDGVVRLYDLRHLAPDRHPQLELRSPLGAATAVALPADPRYVLAGFHSGALRLHPRDARTAFERACATLRRFELTSLAAPYCD